MQRYFTAKEVARYSGVASHWTVDYFCRTGLIVPSAAGSRGRGRPRLFTFADIVILRAIQKLLEKGISPKRLIGDLKKQRKRYRDIQPGNLPERYMVTDGQRIFFTNIRSLDTFSDPDGQFVFGFYIDLQLMQTEVKQKLVAA